jgi:drug/metabolite transporter (DMT)-like permease
VLAGCGGFLAYVLVLAALKLAPAAPVAAVRETSVLFAVLLAAPLLGERVGYARVAGAGLVVCGVLALGAALAESGREIGRTAYRLLHSGHHISGRSKWARRAHFC